MALSAYSCNLHTFSGHSTDTIEVMMAKKTLVVPLHIFSLLRLMDAEGSGQLSILQSRNLGINGTRIMPPPRAGAYSGAHFY